MDLARALAAWRTFSRHLALRRRLAIAVLTGIAVLSGIHAVRPSPPATRPIWVAAHDLSGGETLAAADLRSELLPVVDVPHDAVSTSTAVSGRLLAAPMRTGEPLTDLRLLSPSLLTAADAGDVAVPVRVSDGPAVLALVEVGDAVDIIASADPSSGEPGPNGSGDASTVVHNVRILAIPAHSEGSTNATSSDSSDLAGVLIVAATPGQAADLAAADNGARLTVALPASG